MSSRPKRIYADVCRQGARASIKTGTAPDPWQQKKENLNQDKKKTEQGSSHGISVRENPVVDKAVGGPSREQIEVRKQSPLLQEVDQLGMDGLMGLSFDIYERLQPSVHKDFLEAAFQYPPGVDGIDEPRYVERTSDCDVNQTTMRLPVQNSQEQIQYLTELLNRLDGVIEYQLCDDSVQDMKPIIKAMVRYYVTFAIKDLCRNVRSGKVIID